MKITRFIPLVKASFKKSKTRSVVFFLFILFCVSSILLTVSLILPMWNNMETKVNNHPYNLELAAIISENDTETPNMLKAIEHVEKVYPSPYSINVFNTDGTLNDPMYISYFHNGHTPVITSGRAINDNEKNAIIMPETIRTNDPQTQRSIELDCKNLIGKTLEFQDGNGNEYKLEVVGTFDVTDPALSSDTIYTSYDQLREYRSKLPNDENKVQYSVIVDNYKNRDAVEEECNKLATTYFENGLAIDLGNFNMAIIVLLIVLAVFLIMVIIGTTAFVSSCIGNRTNELALYRSLGYRPGHIFTIIFSEYFIMLIAALITSILIFVIAAEFWVNPYLGKTIGNSIMSMQLKLDIVNILAVFVIFLAIIVLICMQATRKTGKIQLAVLLKEK